ncbi:MAG: hypothetical protein KJ737_08710 [Proteobacteria bacterium]|nr:hypothetical protein [Pseudomonadota bacterium]
MKWFYAPLSLCLLCGIILSGQAYGYPSNKWQHINAGHFIISYDDDTEHLVDDVIKIAQETAEVVGNYFGYDILTDKISIALSDHYDDTNGYAYYTYSLVRLDVRKTEMTLFRGETEQLRTLVSHELAHLYSLRIMKSSFYLNAGIGTISDNDIGWFYTSTGNTRIPEWFIEGLSQSGSHEFKADGRDAYREMLLRDAFIHQRLLSPDEMSIFEGTSREYELVYNQGFDFVLFLQKKYPDKKIKTLCKTIRASGFKNGFEAFYGKSVDTLYEEWVKNLGEKYQGEYDKVTGRLLYPFKKNVLTTELYSVEDGKYVIANWAHDYNRYDLYVMSDVSKEKDVSGNTGEENGSNGRKKIARKINDAGMILKRDAQDGSVYFNRSVYNRTTGVDNYDIYKLSPDGQLSRVTHGKRCLAFDVKDGHLMYAAYDKGTTTLMLRYPDGLEKQLILLESDIAVFNLSMIDTESAVVSMGTGDYKRAGLLKNQELTFIWGETGADVTDCVYAGEDKLVFSATIDGSPQLYWCNIKEDPQTWYKLTNISGGVRFPSLDVMEDGRPTVSCSVFENGDHKRYALDDPFKKTNAVSVDMAEKSPALYEEDAGPSKDETIFHKEEMLAAVPSNIVFSTPPLNVSYQNVSQDSSDSDGGSTGELSIGTTLNLMNAPENSYELIANVDLNFPTGFETSELQYLSGDLFLGMDIRQFYLKAGFSIDTYYMEYDEGIYHDLYKTSRVQSQVSLFYQLFSDDAIRLSFTSVQDDLDIEHTVDGEGSAEGNIGKTFKSKIWALRWEHATTLSKFDPADLGTPYFKLGADIEHHDNAYPVYLDMQNEFGEAYLSSTDNHYNDTGAIRTSFDTEGRMMFAMNRLTVKLLVDGFLWDGGSRGDKIAPYTYDYLGSENFYSGYTYYQTRVRKSLRGVIEVRVNPLISILDRTFFYERCNLGLKYEIGEIGYFSYGTETAHPQSFQTTFTCLFDFWKDRKSSFYITWAKPLEKIGIYQDDLDSRIYFGFVL